MKGSSFDWERAEELDRKAFLGKLETRKKYFDLGWELTNCAEAGRWLTTEKVQREGGLPRWKNLSS